MVCMQILSPWPFFWVVFNHSRVLMETQKLPFLQTLHTNKTPSWISCVQLSREHHIMSCRNANKNRAWEEVEKLSKNAIAIVTICSLYCIDIILFAKWKEKKCWIFFCKRRADNCAMQLNTVPFCLRVNKNIFSAKCSSIQKRHWRNYKSRK